MSKAKFKIKPWGPKTLQKIHEDIAREINERTPLSGCGIKVGEEPDGMPLSLDEQGNPNQDDAGGAGGGGTPVNVYGALNGAPAVFHLLQSSPPTPLP